MDWLLGPSGAYLPAYGAGLLLLSASLLCGLLLAKKAAHKKTAEAEVAKVRLELVSRAAGAFEYGIAGDVMQSDGLFRALGYPVGSMARARVEELVHPQDRTGEDWKKALLPLPPGGCHAQELRLRNAGGGYVWFFLSGRSLNLDGKNATVGMAMDIDRYKRMEDHALQSERLAAAGQLAGGVAHDISNQLMTIQTSLGLLSTVADEVQRRKYMSYLQEALSNAMGILKRLVRFSSGEDEEFLPVSMNALLQISRELLARSMPGVRLTLRLDAQADQVLGSYFDIQNAVYNIVLNARDALPEAGGEIAVRAWQAEVNALQPGADCKWYYVSVRDNGSGMSAEVQKRIFDPFFTTKPHGKGTGLGLFTTYGSVRRHGGTISVESEQGRGTEFVLAFPMAECVAATAAQARAAGRANANIAVTLQQ